MGSFGGAEIAYGSDLDVLVAYEGDQCRRRRGGRTGSYGAVPSFERLHPRRGDRLHRRLSSPRGPPGPARGACDGFEEYHRRWGATWERQALLRARPVAGDAAVIERFVALADKAVWATPLDEASEREIRRMKARVQRERIPPSDDPQFHLKLGRGSLSDVEWTVQLLQLRTATRASATATPSTAWKRDGAVSAPDAAILREAYRFCAGPATAGTSWATTWPGQEAWSEAERTPCPDSRSSSRALPGASGRPRRTYASPYRRVTRRSRKVVERLFYGL